MSTTQGQTLNYGLKPPFHFAWLGAFSTGWRGLDSKLELLRKDPEQANDKLNLLFLAVGKRDMTLERHRQLSNILGEIGIEHEHIETEGDHNWWVWHRHLAEFLPRLFR